MKKLLILLVVFVLTLPVLACAESTAPTVQPIDLTPIFQALIGLLAAVVTVKVIPWIKAKTTAEQQQKMLAAAKTAVYAAEQMLGPGFGKNKLEQVRVWLIAQGYDVNSQSIISAIEAAVQQLSLAQTKPPDAAA